MRQLPFWARGPGADRGPEPALLFLALIAAACLPSSRYSVGNTFFDEKEDTCAALGEISVNTRWASALPQHWEPHLEPSSPWCVCLSVTALPSFPTWRLSLKKCSNCWR